MRVYLAGMTAIASVVVISCSNDPESSSSARSYQAAGSRWAIELTDSTFSLNKFSSISDTSADMTVSGTVTENGTNLFKIMSVSSASGTGAPSAGATAFALEMEGSSTFIVPFGESNPLVATAVSTCPTGDIMANWVLTRPRLDSGNFAPSSFDQDGAGTAFFDQSADTFLVRGSAITDGVLQSAAAGTLFSPFGMNACSAGRLPVSAMGQSFDMYFTPTGQIVVKFPAALGDQIISGFPETSSPVSSTDLNGTYSVLLYRGGNNINASQESVVPAKLVLSGGSGAVTEITDLSSNTEDSTAAFSVGSFSVTDDASTALSNGLFRLAITGETSGGGDGAGELTCATTDGSPRVIACYGYYNTGGNTGNERRPVSILGRKR